MRVLPWFLLLCAIDSFVGSCTMNNDSGAIVFADDLVKEKLLAPSTATFYNEKVIERKGNLFLVYVNVNAQNVYGTMLRKYFLVVLEVASGRHLQCPYYSKPSYAVQELDEPLDQMSPYEAKVAVGATKQINGWDTWQPHNE